MMLLEQRRVFDVQQQMGALRAEFKTWRNESNPNTELEKHHTQILRITGVLEAYLDRLATPEGGIRSNDDLLAALLFVQRTWAYFRDMFALRTVRMLPRRAKVCGRIRLGVLPAVVGKGA